MTEWRGDMADVAEICGEDVAEELVAKLPGIVFYVPKRIREEKDGLINKLEPAIADRLVGSFGGDTLYIAKGRPTYLDTFAAIEELVDEGLTAQKIALKLGVTEAWVYTCRRKAGAPKIANKPDRRQLPLFE